MLTRFVAALCLVAVTRTHAGPADDKMFLGMWRDDVSDRTARITFRPDHSFVMQAGEPLVTFLEGSWRVQDGRMFILRVKAAGKAIEQGQCGSVILSVSSDTFVLEASDPQGKRVTYTRVR